MAGIEERAPHPAFFGLALITIGALFLLRELDVLPDIRFWTLLWLGLGGWLFVGTLVGRRRGWFWPLTLLAIGVFMLLQDLDYIGDDFRLWPILVIAVGASILLEAAGRSGGGNGRTGGQWDPRQDV